MPNWCEGKLKIRGKEEDIIKFLKEGTVLIGINVTEQIIPEVKNECGDIEILNKDLENHTNTLYIKGTRRHFIKLQNYGWYLYKENKKEQLISVDFKAAWAIDTDALRVISKRYNIDFKIYAFECGMEFNQDIEIIKGKIIKDDEINFTDYAWECIDNELGG